GLELVGKADGSRPESAKPFAPGRPNEGDSRIPAPNEGDRPTEARYKPAEGSTDAVQEADAVRRTAPGDKSTTDKLVDFVRNNRKALEQMMAMQGDLSPALQEFAGIMRELDAADAATQAPEEAPFAEVPFEIIDSSDEVVASGDNVAVRMRSRQEH